MHRAGLLVQLASALRLRSLWDRFLLSRSFALIRMRTVNRSAPIIFDIMANYRLGKQISLRTSTVELLQYSTAFGLHWWAATAGQPNASFVHRPKKLRNSTQNSKNCKCIVNRERERGKWANKAEGSGPIPAQRSDRRSVCEKISAAKLVRNYSLKSFFFFLKKRDSPFETGLRFVFLQFKLSASTGCPERARESSENCGLSHSP